MKNILYELSRLEKFIIEINNKYNFNEFKKFRDDIYNNNIYKVKLYLKKNINNLDKCPIFYFSVLMNYSYRLITPFGLACRRGCLNIAKELYNKCL